jgi:hypothetical protein
VFIGDRLAPEAGIEVLVLAEMLMLMHCFHRSSFQPKARQPIGLTTPGIIF